MISWMVMGMDCYPNKDGRQNVVFKIHWMCYGKDGDFIGSVCSASFVPEPTGEFTEYANLTEQQVLDWLWVNGVDKVETEATVQSQLDAQRDPPFIQPPLPWPSAPKT